MISYLHKIAQFTVKMWNGRRLVEDNVPDSFETYPPEEMKPFTVEKEVGT